VDCLLFAGIEVSTSFVKSPLRAFEALHTITTAVIRRHHHQHHYHHHHHHNHHQRKIRLNCLFLNSTCDLSRDIFFWFCPSAAVIFCLYSEYTTCSSVPLVTLHTMIALSVYGLDDRGIGVQFAKETREFLYLYRI
jgi:hypothetical protein